MDLQTLRSTLRYEYLDDKAIPHLWQDVQLDRFINEACIEAALRSLCIHDRFTTPVTKGVALYTLPASALSILNAHISDRPRLSKVALADLEGVPAWDSRSGHPCAYVFDSIHHGGEGTLTLYPKPVEDGALHIRYASLPAPLLADTDVPDIPEALHPHLLSYAAHRAFALRDSDAGDRELSLKHLAAFEKHFGETMTTQTRAARHEGRRHWVRINPDTVLQSQASLAGRQHRPNRRHGKGKAHRCRPLLPRLCRA